MKYIILTIVTFFLLNIFSCALHPQEVDLVKLKKKEEERKKKTKKSKHVLTNDNLDKIDVPKKPYALIKVEKKGKGSGQTGGISTASAGSEGEGEGEGRRTREYWQQEKKKLLDQVNDLEVEINRMQDEYNQLMITHPAEDILTKRISMKNRMDELFKLIPEYKQRLENLKKELEALEDRARKAGVPPGWLRDVEAAPPQKEMNKEDR
jgi:hypothetical protein